MTLIRGKSTYNPKIISKDAPIIILYIHHLPLNTLDVIGLFFYVLGVISIKLLWLWIKLHSYLN